MSFVRKLWGLRPFGPVDFGFAPFVAVIAFSLFAAPAMAQDASSESGLAGEMGCAAVHPGVTEGEAKFGRTICADVVAFDQTLVYNRFGSFNPFGMMFALRRDVVPASQAVERTTADQCDGDDGTGAYSEKLEAGKVRLRDCKRPRPMVIRANVGDVLHVRLTNLLRPAAPNFSSNFCGSDSNPSDAAYKILHGAVSQDPDNSSDGSLLEHKEISCRNGSSSSASTDDPYDWPASRGLNFAIQGLTAFAPQGGSVDPVCRGLTAIATGRSIDCYYKILREGPYFVASTAAPSGGEGDGGSITHGLFGSVVAEKTGTNWYRSQVSKAALASARTDGAALVDYAKTVKGNPVLNLLQPAGDGAYRLFHNDLNAIIETPAAGDRPAHAFREFSVFFHDELKSFVTRNFDELGMFGEGQLAGVRDGFAINYGASGMGTILLANRKGIGPAANCAECLYEEFFLSSWANGDPALLEWFSDDPSNVHHSYLNDAVVFRNVHAGPKETHVFHLHAHQWFAGNDNNRGAYLDSQTVGPQQSFSYDISGGGLEVFHRGKTGEKGWWETLGSGNRNRTPGDSIFHCHLYPHFAQGMWELWRVHDVLEDGTRKLPDGQWNTGLTLEEEEPATRAKARPGSVDPKTGRLIATSGDASRLGTPVPALVPLPHQAAPLLPTYPEETADLDPETGKVTAAPIAEVATFPGYPYYIPGSAGHRPPQAPLDIAKKLNGNTTTDDYLDGGLPRHVLGDGSTRKPGFDVPESLPALSDRKSREEAQTRLMAKALALGDMTMHFEKIDAALLPYDGTPLERAAMAFHHNGKLESGTSLTLKTATQANAVYDTARSGYVAASDPSSLLFPVNGAEAKPGSPFADPCGAPDALGGLRQAADGKVYYKDASGVDHEVYFAASVSDMTTDPAQAQPLYVNGKRDLRPGVVYTIQNGQSQQAANNLIRETDPMTGTDFTSDPGVIGFRRYEASAVQLDMVTNRAGWHDPQARINVLTNVSDNYKTGGGRFSSKVSASEQPFFFRALSGECIEFRHTNELPKDLALDDFQVKTPTDTIGQHIHLVKFDVTASDGSGNGWNYEDGTFAPDEIAARICAAKGGTVTGGGIVTNRVPGALDIREQKGLCEFKDGKWHVAANFNDIWRRKLSTNRDLFQTTIQRWFADPILSNVRPLGDTASDRMADRTLRTVFSHDHFGPSSIQQHGFYTALVIEPSRSQTCAVDNDLDATQCTPRRADRDLRVATAADVGARKIIRTPKLSPTPVTLGTVTETPDTRDTREFALAIADFATLYDPRDSETEQQLVRRLNASGTAHSFHGMAMLACEAQHAANPQLLNKICNSGMIADKNDPLIMYGKPGDIAPAWLAAGRPGDFPAHRLAGDAGLSVSTAEADKLRGYLIAYRRMAAGYAGSDVKGRLAKPVAPPRRPESISVDHHDPYLFNYRGEPLPLRIGMASNPGTPQDCDLQKLADWETKLQSGVTERCSIDMQKPGDKGDMSNVFASVVNGDPVTPILESRDGDTVQLRLIQGAQEVQHTFTVEDHTLQRNQDQFFPSGMRPLNDITPPVTLVKDCETVPLDVGGVPFARLGRADQYAEWFNKGTGNLPAGDQRYWSAYDKRVARCFNTEGRIAAQEVGISEHFEFTSAYLYDSNKFGGMMPLMRKFNPVPDFFPKTIEPDVSDTLVHFGSVDALWNGAWGLLRVRKTSDGGREKRQIAMCDPKAPKVYAAVVAIEARRLLRRGGRTVSAIDRIRYAPGLDDPDGLFFAIVDPRKVMNPIKGDFTAWVGKPAAWKDIPLERVQTEILRTYDRPEPMVLTVKAGDCLNLTVLNALTSENGYLRDGKGDARMPPIVPLNIDVTWDGGDGPDTNSPETFDGSGPDGLKPSARLAVSVALPVLNAQSTMPRPIGKSQIAALASIEADDTMSMSPIRADWGQITQVEIYAGLAVSTRTADDINTNALISLADSYSQAAGAGNAAALQAIDPDGSVARLATGIEDLQRVAVPTLQDNIKRFSGQTITIERPRLSPDTSGESQIWSQKLNDAIAPAIRQLNASQQRELQLNLDKALQVPFERLSPSIADARLSPTFPDKLAVAAAEAKTHFIPYAFGALPFKSQGDVIGHGAHGLFGAIVSVPKDATALNSRAPRVASPGCRTLLPPVRVGRPESLNDLPLLLPSRLSLRQLDCYYVISPTEQKTQPLSVATMEVPRYGADATADHPSLRHPIRQFTLFWQDGLNLVDRSTQDKHLLSAADYKLVANCRICDDSYDWGERAVSYRSEPFNRRMRAIHGAPIESHYNLNAYDFGKDFFRLRSGEPANPPMQVLRAAAGEEVVIHVVHPGGRARQRAFVTIAQDYDDLFPGFGFPRGALLAPGKALTASLTRPLEAGCYLWFDGPMQTRAGGAWGLLDVVAADRFGDATATACAGNER